MEDIKYYVLHADEKIKFDSLESAQNYTRFLTFEWAIIDKEGKIVFDWIDRIGP